jgi:hypothetical protein
MLYTLQYLLPCISCRMIQEMNKRRKKHFIKQNASKINSEHELQVYKNTKMIRIEHYNYKLKQTKICYWTLQNLFVLIDMKKPK